MQEHAALAFKDEATRAEYADGSNDMTLKRTLEIMSEDLDARGVGRLDIDVGYDDPTNRQLIHSTYKAPTLNDASRRKIR